MDDIPSNVTILEPILQEIISSNITLSEDEIKEANKHLKTVLLASMEEEMKKDETFKKLYKEPQYGGSYYENLKVGHPNEFDINLELELPINGDNIQIDTNGTEPGFTKIKVNKIFKQNTSDAVKRKIENWLESGEYLSRDKVIQWLEGIVDRCLTRITWPFHMKVSKSTSGPAVTLHVEMDNVKYDVDLVPVFRFNIDKWPSRPIRKAHNIPRSINTSSLRWCVVPKSPRNAPSTEIQWRMSFYMIEKELMNDLNNMKPVIKLFKLLRDKQNWVGLSSYYIKTLFMWEQEKNINDEKFWRKPLSYIFMHMLNVLKGCLDNHRIEFFWHKKCNLIDHLSTDFVNNMAGRTNTLKKIIHRALRSELELSEVKKILFTTSSELKQGQLVSASPESPWFRSSDLKQGQLVPASPESSWLNNSVSPESSWITHSASSERQQAMQSGNSVAGWGLVLGGVAALGLGIGSLVYQNRNRNQ